MEEKTTSEQIINDKLHRRFDFRPIRPEETDQGIRVEQSCFPPNEACSSQHMRERIKAATELFLVTVDRDTGKVAGFLNGVATNEEQFQDAFFTDITLHRPEGKNIMLTGLAVLPPYRKRGLARELVREYVRLAQRDGRQRLILTCLDEKVSMYEKFGFTDDGLAASAWGGEQWHSMTYWL